MNKPWLKLSDIKTDRWTKAGNGRLLPLNSAAWRKLRANVLAGEPLCRHCAAMGLNVPATEVDHQDNKPANNDPANLCPLCKPCHSRKTARDMGGNVRMGCDVHGTPLDHDHPWSNAATGVLTSREAEVSPATHSPEPYVPLQFNAKCKEVP
jgi:5-methylcytosine-specific restriction enzyme A